MGIWAYVFLAVLVAVEGPMATLAGAAAAAGGVMHIPGVYAAAVIGNLSADSLWYLLGRLGKTGWILHFGRRMGLSPHLLADVQDHLHRHAQRWILAAKLTAGLMIPTLVVAGLLRIPWRRWFPAVFAGELLWTTSLVFLGYHATRYLSQIAKGVEAVTIGGAFVAMILALFLLQRWLLRKVQSRKEIDS